MLYLHQIDPIALQLGPVAIHWYGVMYLLGFACAYALGAARIKRGYLPIAPQAFGDLAFAIMFGVIIGGRVGYMLFYGYQQLFDNPLSLLKVWEGGMSFHGGLLGVLASAAWWAKKNQLAFWDTMDFLVPLIPPGLGFGRLGNFIGGELWGKLTNAPWGVIFPKALPHAYSAEALQAAYQAGELQQYARHPSQLYEFLLEGVVLFLVLYWVSRTPQPRYRISGLFACLYGAFRFAIEFVREPDAHIGYLTGWLTMGQLLTIPILLLGCGLLYLSFRPENTVSRPLVGR